MGCKELIESLRKIADEKAGSIRQEAETEAEKIRADARRRIEQMRERHAGMLSAKAGEKTAAVLSDAHNRARGIMLTAERDLSERLFSLAVSSLQGLRDRRYSETFDKLARELPALPWRTARVNQEDAGLARKYFPDAEVVPDTGITGGMDVAAEAGKIRVINTFEKRLERAWVDMLPELIKDIYEEASHHGAP